MYRDCRMNVDPNIKKAVLELLFVCNLNCKHCIYKSLSKKSSYEFISKEKAFKLIDSFVFAEIDKLVLTGGEPTIHPFFVEISKYAIMKIPKVSICTNGVIFNRSLERRIIDLNFSKALKETIKFLKKLKAKKKKISIHITLNPNNIDHIEETIKFCKKFTDEVAVGTIYHNSPDKKNRVEDFNKKVKFFKTKFIDDPNLILIGFTPFCENKNCLDLKNVFMINCKGELVDCYWKTKKIRQKIYFKKYFTTKL